MTNEAIKTKLEELKTIFAHGKYWSHDYGTTNDPAYVSDTTTTHTTELNKDGYIVHHDNGSCGCNSFNSAIQCHGFSMYMAYLIFNQNISISSAYNGATNVDVENSDGWKVHTHGNYQNISIEPGDIIRIGDLYGNGHTAIVWKVDDGIVSVAEVWGSVNNRIAWGYWNGTNDPNLSTVQYLKDNALYIVKHPGSATPTPEPEEPEEIKVPVTFKKNTQSDGGPVIETREYVVGQAYGSFPSAGSRTGYTFDGWYTDEGKPSF